MGGQFQSAHAGYEAAAGFGAAGAEGFAAQMRHLMGEEFEPDSRFLEESWTMGVAAAAESWRARRQGQAERERQSHAFREMDSVGALAFIQASEWYAEIRRSTTNTSASSATSTTIAGRFDAGWLQRCAEEPFGWSQSRETVADETGQVGESSEEPVAGMTVGRACRLLGLTAASTREQIKAAYRRMASQWHPDRLGRGAEEARRRATEQMAEINEAYRLLRRVA